MNTVCGWLFFVIACQGVDIDFPPFPETPSRLKVAFIADHFRTDVEPATTVFQLVRDENPDMVIHMGDIGYYDPVDYWCYDYLGRYISTDIPYFATPGENKPEVEQWFEANVTEYGNTVSYVECLLNHNGGIWERDCFCPDNDCSDKYGIAMACVTNGILVIYVGYELEDYLTPWDYDDDYYLEFVREVLEHYRDIAPWKICAYHYALGIHVISRPVSSRWTSALHDLCREYGAITMAGNSHTYSRTHLMTSFDKNEWIDAMESSPDNPIEIRAGQSMFIVNGMGGGTYHEWLPEKIYNSWWAAVGTMKTSKSYDKSSHTKYKDDLEHGVLLCYFRYERDDNLVRCEFQQRYNLSSYDEFWFEVTDVRLPSPSRRRRSPSTGTSPSSTDSPLSSTGSPSTDSPSPAAETEIEIETG